MSIEKYINVHQNVNKFALLKISDVKGVKIVCNNFIRFLYDKYSIFSIWNVKIKYQNIMLK